MRNALLLTTLLAFCLSPRASGAGDEAAATQPTQKTWDAIAKAVGAEGKLADDVFTIVLKRTDLDVFHEDGQIPAAVLKSEFQFFMCDCGKMEVVGQFCVADYEANDVIDALRAGMIKVASVGPMFLGEHPRVMLVRFQGSGGAQNLAKTIKDALDWTGEARMAPATRPKRTED